MAKYNWCFDSATPLVDDSGNPQIVNARNAYVKKFKDVHDSITLAEWDNIVSNWNLDEYGIKGFETKPPFEELFGLSKTSRGSWLDAINNFRSRTSIEVKLFETQKEHARIGQQLSSKLNELFTAFGQYAQVANTDPGTFRVEKERAKEIIRLYTQIYNRAIAPPQGTSGITYDLLQPDLQQILTVVQDADLADARRKYSNVYPVPRLSDLIIDIEEKLAAFSAVCKEEDSFKKEYLEELNKLFLPEIADIEARIADYEMRAKYATGTQKADLLLKAAELRAKLADKASATAAAVEAAFASEVIYKEQCFLLGNLAELVEYKKSLPDPLRLPYVETSIVDEEVLVVDADGFNTPLHIQGSPFAFVNKLAVSPTQKELFKLKVEELSSLTPHMRFFKVDSDKEGKDISTEIKFDTNNEKDVNAYISRKGKGGRGLGVGVKSFTFSYDGSDPFSAKKAISAKLTLYAPSFSDLLRPRGEKRKYRYVDLALKTGNYKSNDDATSEALKNIDSLDDIERDNLDKLNFRLQVLVELSANKETLRLLENEEKKDAVYDSAITMYLTPTIHEFDFDDAGGVTFTINYLAYIEDYFSQSNFDVFGSLNGEKTARDMTYDYFRQANCDFDGVDYAQFREADSRYITNSNSNSLQRIVKLLGSNNKIYYLSASKKDIRKWLQNPIDNSYIVKPATYPSTSLTDQVVNAATAKAQSSAPAGEAPNPLEFKLSLVSNNDLTNNLAFFYLSDLLDVVMYNIEESLGETQKILDSKYVTNILAGTLDTPAPIISYIGKRIEKQNNSNTKATLRQFEKMRVILGPMEITPFGKNSVNNRAISCTLGDIPISLNYFIDFLSEKVLSKDFVQYPFSKFVKDIVNDCLRNFINADGCFEVDASQKVSLNSTTVLAYNTRKSEVGRDDLTSLITSTDYSKKNCLMLENVAPDYFPILKTSGPSGPRSKGPVEDMINYYIFTVGRKYPTDAYTGNPAKDAKNGIFHYVLGDKVGIVKNISLDKTSAPGLKELRFEQEGFDGLEQLREVYNANITTFLNPQTFPGTYIYVEPRGFDPTATEDLTRFGIGGYYMITKTSHNITPGNAETQINAAWVASKGGKVHENKNKKRQVEGSEKTKKCRVQALQNSINKRG